MVYKPHKIIREKNIKKENQKQFWSVFFIEGGLFLLTSILAVVSTFKLNELTKIGKAYLPTTPLQNFLFSFIFIIFFVLIFILYKNKKLKKFKEITYKAIFIIIVFWG